MNRRGYRSFLENLLTPLKLTQSHRDLSFFQTKRTEKLHFQGSPNSNTHTKYCWLIGVGCGILSSPTFPSLHLFILITDLSPQGACDFVNLNCIIKHPTFVSPAVAHQLQVLVLYFCLVHSTFRHLHTYQCNTYVEAKSLPLHCHLPSSVYHTLRSPLYTLDIPSTPPRLQCDFDLVLFLFHPSPHSFPHFFITLTPH